MCLCAIAAPCNNEYYCMPKIGKHSLKVNNANFAPAQCQLCDNARCATFSYHQLIFNTKARKRAKLALCKTMQNMQFPILPNCTKYVGIFGIVHLAKYAFPIV